MPFVIYETQRAADHKAARAHRSLYGGARFSLLEVASPLHAQGRSGLPKYRPLLGYNTEDNCTFWTMWSANAPEYLEWCRKQWSDEKPSGDTLGDLADWNIPGWSRGPAGPRYTLTNAAEDAAVSASFRSDIEGAELPWLERVSTWEGAAEHFRKQRWRYDKAADFLLIAGRLEEAHAMILE